MKFDDRKHINVEDLTEELFEKVIGYCFVKYGLGGPGCVRMITEEAEELQLSGKDLNELDFYTEWSNLFPVLRYFTHDGIRLDFSKKVKAWTVIKNEFDNPMVIRKEAVDEIIKKTNNRDFGTVAWDDELIRYALNNFPKKNRIMVLTVQHPYDSVEVLGVFDDKEVLRNECLSIIDRDAYLVNDIVGNLHIFECPINELTGVFYPNNYDDLDSIGCFMEEQNDICKEVLGEDFF